MKKALFIFCVFIHFLSNSQDLKLEWVKNLSASMGANGISSCFDKDGNVYQTGVFSRIINIDGQLTESKDNSSIFILKYDNKGSLLWSKVIGNYPIGVHKIETDISGNLIVLGYFYGETQFEPGYTISPLKNGIGGFVMSLSKYGNINWLNNLEYRPKHMDLDSSGNIYLSGFFSEDIDFDHSENISKLDRNSYSAMSLYCVKIKNNGNFEFVKNILNKHGFIQNGNLAAIKNDNSSIFLSGWYNGQFEIETKGKRLIQLNSKNTNTYLLKYNLLTDSITICTNKNIDIDGENEVKDIAIDLNGNIYLYGSCKALVNFNPKNDSTILNGNFFFSKYDSNLKLNYTKVFSSNGNYQNNNIRIDELNQIYLTGSILSNGVTDFDPSPNKFETKTLGGFILKLDYNSEFKYVNFLESSDFVINNISVKQNDLVLTGYFKGSIDFDIDTSVYKVTNNIMDCYIVKYNTCFPTLNNLIEKNCDFYIAPNRDKITKSGKYTFVIPNHKGCDSIITLDLTINSAYAIYTGVSGLDTTICEGSPIKLKGKGPAVSYSWDKGVIDNVTFTPLITDTYTVTGNDINGCSSKASVLINVAKYPDIKIINQWGRILCLSESVKLTSQSSMGGLTYCWKLNGEILKYQTNSTLTNDLGGDYSLEVSKNGCKTVSEIERVQKIITPTIDTSSILQICQGSLAPNLHSNDTVGAISWNYSSNNKDWYLFENIHDQTIKGIDIGVLNSIKYIRCSVNTPWCPDAPSNPIKLNVNQRPTVSGGLDQTVCVGTETILAGQGALQYKWNKGIENIKSFFIDTTTTFSVIGTDQNGCKDTASVTIYTFPASKIQISEPETIICNNREFMLSTISDNVYSFQWKNNNKLIPNETSNTLKTKLSGDFVVLVTNKQGCESMSAPISISPLPLPEIDAGENQTICNGDSVTLNASKADKFTWENNFQNGGFVSPQNTTSYKVLTTGLNGCTNQDSVIIYVNQPSFHIENVSSTGAYYLNNIPYSKTGQYTQHLINHLGCDSTITLNLVVESLGLNNLEDEHFKIYPNPTPDGKFTIQSDYEIDEIRILNSEGKVLETLKNEKEIDISRFGRGVYFVEVWNRFEIKTIKIVH